jgi:hypothetical protein
VILFERLRNLGAQRVTLSYLHLRPAIQEQLMQELTPLHHRLIESLFRSQDWKTVGSSTKTKLLPKVIREKGYQRIKEIAEGFGIQTSVCQCKNPDVRGNLCSSGRVRASLGRKTQAQLPLFRC